MKYFFSLFSVYFLTSCSSLDKKELEVSSFTESPVIKSVNSIVTLDEYDVKTIELQGTVFHLYGRKNNGIGLKKLEKSLLKMWPIFSKASIINLWNQQ